MNAAAIRVDVRAGVVTLLGQVESYAKKWAAERIVARIEGVLAVAQDLRVLAQRSRDVPDRVLIQDVERALAQDVRVPPNVLAQVEGGIVVLVGTVTWTYQQISAVRAVRRVAGVVAVHDFIQLDADALEARRTEELEHDRRLRIWKRGA